MLYHKTTTMKKKIKILLVDDDLKNSMLLKRFIEAEGYEVTYANNGNVGLEMYRSEHPDLILLDINMPELDGFEMAKTIRRNDKKTVIFFLTDRTDKVDRLHGFSLKGNDYIPKPFYPEELIARIHERFDSMTADQDVEFQLGDTIFRPNLSSITYEDLRDFYKNRVLAQYFPVNAEDEESKKRVEMFIDSMMKNEEEVRRVYDMVFEEKLTAIFKDKVKVDKKSLSMEDFVEVLKKDNEKKQK